MLTGIESMTDRARLKTIAEIIGTFMARKPVRISASDCDEAVVPFDVLLDIYRLATLPEIRQRGLFKPKHYDSNNTSIT